MGKMVPGCGHNQTVIMNSEISFSILDKYNIYAYSRPMNSQEP